MLEDRSYMRGSQSDRQWSVTVVLLIVNAAAFLIQSFIEAYVGREGTRHTGEVVLYTYFALSPAGLAKGFVWQLLTFQFMHGGLMHLLFNSLAIYVFGRPVEETLGKMAFLKLYFSSGIFGGLVQVLGAWIWGTHIGGGPVVGASAGAFGLVAAFAALFPNRPLTLLLAFIIPINMRAKYLLLFEALLALYGIVFINNDNVAHAAHLGGILCGLAYIQLAVKHSGWRFPWPRFRPVTRPRELVNASWAKHSAWQRTKATAIDDLPPEEFISREVDPILDKISAHGIQSLTDRERKILEAARAKMAKR